MLGLMTGVAARSGFSAALPAGLTQPRVPAANPTTPAKAELGRRLFYDADLSVDGTMACATCHEQHRGFGDGNATHPGVHGDPARRNVPGLANVAWFSSAIPGPIRVSARWRHRCWCRCSARARSRWG
jgi:cytochrome c peroxidase